MQRRVLKGDLAPYALQVVRIRPSERVIASFVVIFRSPSCGYFLRLLSAWIVAPRNLLFLRPNCASSQRETPPQVNLELSLTSH